MGKKAAPQPIRLAPELIEKIQALVLEQVEPLLEERFFLVGVALEREVGQWYLRLFIEGRGFRISLNECEAISRRIEPAIDALFDKQPEVAQLSYYLEVSSPGLFRPLQSAREFSFYQGTPVKVQVGESGPLQEGSLEGYDTDTQTLQLSLASGTERLSIPLTAETRVLLNPTLEEIK